MVGLELYTGFPANADAEKLAKSIFEGAAEIFIQERSQKKESTASELVTRVATKGGITEAGLKTMIPQSEELFLNTFQASLDRSKELNKENLSK